MDGPSARATSGATGGPRAPPPAGPPPGPAPARVRQAAPPPPRVSGEGATTIHLKPCSPCSPCFPCSPCSRAKPNAVGSRVSDGCRRAEHPVAPRSHAEHNPEHKSRFPLAGAVSPCPVWPACRVSHKYRVKERCTLGNLHGKLASHGSGVQANRAGDWVVVRFG